MNRVPGPWLLKPRAQASGIGMKKIHTSDETVAVLINWVITSRNIC